MPNKKNQWTPKSKNVIPLEIPRTSLLFKLRDNQYKRYLKNKEVSTMDVLSVSINEAYTIGFAAGQTAKEEALVNETKAAPHFQQRLLDL